jgi:hypothetical protein
MEGWGGAVVLPYRVQVKMSKLKKFGESKEGLRMQSQQSCFQGYEEQGEEHLPVFAGH